MIPVFVSRPNPFTSEQEHFLKEMIMFLDQYNIQSVTLKAKDYNPHESLTCLNEMIKRCYGMIIIAFGQTYINKGISKKGGVTTINFFESKENNVDNTWVTSPFCHIEGAMAFSNNLPIFIINQDSVTLDGMLKKGSHATTAPSFSLDSSYNAKNYFKESNFIDNFNSWKQSVDEFYNFINKSIIK